jgi:hypothetical protein
MRPSDATPLRARLLAIYIHFDMLFFKPLYWLGDSQNRVREFAPEA